MYNYALSADEVTKLYNGESPTGLNAVRSQKPEEGEEASQIFDISGKRYNTPHKGINIINGKKINY